MIFHFSHSLPGWHFEMLSVGWHSQVQAAIGLLRGYLRGEKVGVLDPKVLSSPLHKSLLFSSVL